MEEKNIFLKKKFLIYGLGKSGLSSYFFLRKKNDVFLYDDNKNIIKNHKFKNCFIELPKIFYSNFDFIVISPGININKCPLKNFLKKNKKHIITDLDIFYYYYYKNTNITITGTNGKSTTAQILFDVLKNQKRDVRLVGNIGKPILNEKKITKNTIFVIEASSYQIEYSKNFRTNYALILNITPDHLERHVTFLNYIRAKFKLIKNQTNKDFYFLDCNNNYLKKEIKKTDIKSNLINVQIKSFKKEIAKINNSYFLTDGNRQNLTFIFAIAKKLKLKKKILFETIEKFKGLKFRQQIIHQTNKITIINDSKSTSYSSSVNILKSLKRVYWIIGGIPKNGDKFLISKKNCKNFRGYIFGKYKNHFIKGLNNKLNYQTFNELDETIKKIILDIKLEKKKNHKTILFSPAAASFDKYKNFEDRGNKFNFFVKKLKLKKILNV